MPSLLKRIRFNLRKTQLTQRFFSFFERRGVHVSPVHFYSPIPDTRTLETRVWDRKWNLGPIDMRDEDQVALATFTRTTSLDLFLSLVVRSNNGYTTPNEMFDGIDGLICYSLVRRHRPTRVIEVGSGHSTLLLAAALQDAGGDAHEKEVELLTIDPYPLPSASGTTLDSARLKKAHVQDIPREEFDQLEKDDVLFIDSSHIVSIGSDLHYLFSRIIPSVAPGVLIHFHDIFLPEEYPREWVTERHWFFNEQYFLSSFMSFNPEFEVVWASRYMQLNHPEVVGPLIERVRGATVGSSFWVRRRT